MRKWQQHNTLKSTNARNTYAHASCCLLSFRVMLLKMFALYCHVCTSGISACSVYQKAGCRMQSNQLRWRQTDGTDRSWDSSPATHANVKWKKKKGLQQVGGLSKKRKMVSYRCRIVRRLVLLLLRHLLLLLLRRHICFSGSGRVTDLKKKM